MENKVIILSAGMNRSASTLMFNIVRLILENNFNTNEINSCWVKDFNSMPDKKYNLIKIHLYDDEIATKSNCTFYSYRDVRDAVASIQRKFNQKPTMRRFDSIIEAHENWHKVADMNFEYELIKDHIGVVVKQIEDMLRIKKIIGHENVLDKAQLQIFIRRLNDLKFEAKEGESDSQEYHALNQYHKNHITDGRSGLWRDQIDKNLINKVMGKYSWWFEKYGYPLD